MLFHAWNVGELEDMALPPCHMVYQFHTAVDEETGERRLSMLCLQRSADIGWGCPSIAVSKLCCWQWCPTGGYEPGEIIWFGGDVHLYLNHVHLAETVLKRELAPFRS